MLKLTLRDDFFNWSYLLLRICKHRPAIRYSAISSQVRLGLLGVSQFFPARAYLAFVGHLRLRDPTPFTTVSNSFVLRKRSGGTRGANAHIHVLIAICAVRRSHWKHLWRSQVEISSREVHALT